MLCIVSLRYGSTSGQGHSLCGKERQAVNQAMSGFQTWGSLSGTLLTRWRLTEEVCFN